MGYDEQLSAAKFRAERDQARQECERLRARLRNSVPREAYERKRAAWLRHIRECETALHRRREYIKKLENAVLERRIVREEDHEAAEWVRERGGIETLRRMFQDADSRRVELCGALGIDLDKGWSEAMAAMSLRLMPDGMEWPRYESGEPVPIGGEFMGKDGKTYTAKQIQFIGKWFSLYDFCDRKPQFNGFYGERVKRPEPKVLDADGEEIREKRDVWCICEGDESGLHAERLRVETIGPNGLIECSPYKGGAWVYLEPSELYVNEPVIAADGRPLEGGQTVWDWNGDGYVVERIYSGTTEPDFPGHTVACRRPDDIVTHMFKPSQLTHQRPVLDADGAPIKGGDTIYSDDYKEGLIVDGYQHDGSLIAHMRDGNHVVIRKPQHFTHTKPERHESWEQLEDDANAAVCVYFGASVKDCENCDHNSWECSYDKARDLVRRCKELARKENNNE